MREELLVLCGLLVTAWGRVFRLQTHGSETASARLGIGDDLVAGLS